MVSLFFFFFFESCCFSFKLKTRAQERKKLNQLYQFEKNFFFPQVVSPFWQPLWSEWTPTIFLPCVIPFMIQNPEVRILLWAWCLTKNYLKDVTVTA